MLECNEEQTESNSSKDEEGRKGKNRAVDNMEKKDQLNGENCKAMIRISGVVLNSITRQCLTAMFCFALQIPWLCSLPFVQVTINRQGTAT